MVKAILDGRKTVTRRLVKPQLPDNAIEIREIDPLGYLFFQTSDSYLGGYRNRKAPYKSGDILYVRETWRVGAWNEDISSIAVDYKADNSAIKDWIYIDDEEEFQRYWIQSTDDAGKAGLQTDGEGKYHWKHGQAPTRWRPSIHMPKEAARIFLKVTDVRVERLRDMSIGDMISEGINTDGIITTSGPIKYRVINRFEELWNSTIKKSDLDKYSFDANPWVWVIEFERISKEVDYEKCVQS